MTLLQVYHHCIIVILSWTWMVSYSFRIQTIQQANIIHMNVVTLLCMLRKLVGHGVGMVWHSIHLCMSLWYHSLPC
jgi:hypothetical protein